MIDMLRFFTMLVNAPISMMDRMVSIGISVVSFVKFMYVYVYVKLMTCIKLGKKKNIFSIDFQKLVHKVSSMNVWYFQKLNSKMKCKI